MGSTGFVTDQNGELYEHMEYFPFGETWVQEHSNTLRTPYLYTGKELDEETGLYYYGARYYDPRTSVWQSADPIFASLFKDVDGIARLDSKLQLYSYAQQNPIKFIDPDGNDEADAINVLGMYGAQIKKIGQQEGVPALLLADVIAQEQRDIGVGEGGSGGLVLRTQLLLYFLIRPHLVSHKFKLVLVLG